MKRLRENNYKKADYKSGTLLEDKPEERDIENTAKEIAKELYAISLGLEGKIYGEGLKDKLEDILKSIIKKTEPLITKTIDCFAEHFYPTSAKIWSSVLAGSAASAFLKQYGDFHKITDNWNYILYAGFSVSTIAYLVQSLYQKESFRK